MKHCAVCQTDFEPKNAKGIYCSNKCKMAAYRLKRDSPETTQPLAQHIKPSNWQESIAHYCQEQGITPEDLVDTHKLFALRLPNRVKQTNIDCGIPLPTGTDSTTMSRTERLKQLRAKN